MEDVIMKKLEDYIEWKTEWDKVKKKEYNYRHL